MSVCVCVRASLPVCVLVRYCHEFDIDAVLNVSSIYAVFMSIFYVFVCVSVCVRVCACGRVSFRHHYVYDVVVRAVYYAMCSTSMLYKLCRHYMPCACLYYIIYL